jgi:hypothetical protein
VQSEECQLAESWVTESWGRTPKKARRSQKQSRARLTAIRPLQMIGIMLLVAGVAMFHPAIRAFVGSGTLQVGCFAVGTGPIFLPMVIAGHESMVLAIGGAGVLALGVWFLAHRHGKLKGMVETKKNAPTLSDD